MESGSVNAVGIFFYSVSTNRYLYLLRDDPKHPDTWGLPGGKCETGESLLTTIYRECQEELGKMPQYIRLVPIEQFTSADNGFHYHTFFCLVEKEFIPVLNEEHTGYSWINRGKLPRPLHPGLWNTVNMHDVVQKIETVRQIQMSQLVMNSL
jgi:8-oxo-dGTP pyrophosphatase MutT (NUDIX family)